MTDSSERLTGTQALAAQHAFDLTRLDQFMQAHVQGYGGELQLERFKGGQSNPTFKLSAGGKNYVLRRKPSGVLLPSAHAVDREFRVMQALAGTDVPVPRVYALCGDPEVIGTAFYIMECVEGRILWDPSLPGMTPVQRAAHFDELNRVMAALHRVDPQAVGLGDYGKPGNYIERQVGRWSKQYRAAETETVDAANQLMAWLPQHIPAGEQVAIVHGDYRLDNVIFHPTEPRILAVLDWELSTLGHPLVDFAYHCMTWHISSAGSRGLADLDLPALGIPTEQQYLQTYLKRIGRADVQAVSDADWTYYMVFNLFRAASISQGIMARALQGNASNVAALEAGKSARPLAEQAWALARRMGA